MKKIPALLLCAAMTLSLAACGGGQSSGSTSGSNSGNTSVKGSEGLPYAGETLVVQVWGGTYEETLRNHVIPSFESKTGAKVEVVSGAAPLAATPPLMCSMWTPLRWFRAPIWAFWRRWMPAKLKTPKTCIRKPLCMTPP